MEGVATETLRVRVGRVPVEVDPPRSYMLPDIQAQMALFDRMVERWPEATIVPSLAERWQIAEDGLRYVFTLREGLAWSDGTPLTAHDVVFGVKRNLDRDRPGVSVSMLFALENAQDYFRARNDDLDAVGVRALDDRTVEFRLIAPAPYFFSMVNRPDAGPQPRHAIEESGDGWTAPGTIVTSGAFGLAKRDTDEVILERRRGSGGRRGNIARVELVRTSVDELRQAYPGADVDLVWGLGVVEESAEITGAADDLRLEPAAGLDYLVIDHRDPSLAQLEFRQALGHAIDRSELEASLAPGSITATGGMVPPLLQGHTPDIAPPFDPELARRLVESCGVTGEIRIALPVGFREEIPVREIVAMWKRTLGLDIVEVDESDGPAIWFGGWYPGYPDPEYFLRLLLHSEAQDNHGHFHHAPYDELIERARIEPDGRRRLELFHAADRMAVAEQIAAIPLAYFPRHLAREAVGHGLVGVRKIVGIVRRPRRRRTPELVRCRSRCRAAPPHEANPAVPRQPDEQRDCTRREDDDDDGFREGDVEQLDPGEAEDAGEEQAQTLLRDRERQAPADENSGNRAEQEPAQDAEVDVPGGPVRRARDVQQDRRVEDVRPDDLVCAEREDDEQRQTEEDAAPHRRESDDEAAEDSDEHGGDAVAIREAPVGIAGLPALDDALRDQADGAEQQRSAEHLTHDRLDVVAVALDQLDVQPDTEE